MYHELPRNASFWAFLFSIDQDIAEQARQRKCPCGGCLHRANYPRKPRGGGEDLPQEYDFRLSFCCEREGLELVATDTHTTHLEVVAEVDGQKRRSLPEQVLALLAGDAVQTRAALRDALGVKNQRLGEALQSLEQGGQIRRTPTGWRRVE